MNAFRSSCSTVVDQCSSTRRRAPGPVSFDTSDRNAAMSAVEKGSGERDAAAMSPSATSSHYGVPSQ